MKLGIPSFNASECLLAVKPVSGTFWLRIRVAEFTKLHTTRRRVPVNAYRRSSRSGADG
jgi:hypothetical protein